MDKVYIGMDIHKKYTVAVAVDASGHELDRCRLSHGSSVQGVDWERYFSRWEGERHAVIEATGVSYPIYEAIEPYCSSVTMAHPYKTKLIAEQKVKTDTIDGWTLAQLKRVDFLPTAYIPSRTIRDQREVLRHRMQLVALRTQMKNKVHALLTRCGECFPGSDLFGKQGRSYLQTLVLPAVYREQIDRWLDLIDTLDRRVKEVTRAIERHVQETPATLRLMTIPGIGPVLAALIMAEIGEIQRFPQAQKLVGYCGLAPRVHSSGGKTFHGAITKEGNRFLRWALVEAAQKWGARPGALGDFYRRIQRKHGSKTARVALARKLAVVIWAMLTQECDYREEPRPKTIWMEELR